MAEAAPLALVRLVTRARMDEPRRLRLAPALGLPLAGAMIVALVGVARDAPAAPDESGYPRDALATLAAAPREVLNEYDWGGYLIWSAPDHPVFIDGRLFLYLPNVFAEYREATELHPRFRDVLARRHVEAVLLRPSRALAVFLRESGWRVASEDPGRYVLLVRP